MNAIDLFILIPLAWGIYKGFRKGFLFEVAMLIALVLGVWGSMHLSAQATIFLREHFKMKNSLVPFAAFISVFLLILIGVLFIAKFLEKMIDKTPLGLLNKISGMILGCFKWAFILAVIFYFLLPFDNKYGFISQQTKEKSFLFKPFRAFSTFIIPAAKDWKNKLHVG